jgi:hypothetical protein
MKERKVITLRRRLALITLLLLSQCCSRANAGAIITAKNSLLPPLDAEGARRLFLGRIPSINGVEITVIYQQSGTERSDFETKVIGKTGAELNTYMARLIFTGEAKPPLELPGDLSVKTRVNSTAGAVGYINNSAIDGNVKVLYTY